ncbi:hypothetical protein G7054_g2611 [Neopestalotiopsis clavispora]|nr:hypothetical protein G7054_g2611 [Neopestalotiopsis clavispora]
MEMTDDASAPSSCGSPDPTAAGLGQVCDRCRQKKIKCDAAIPSCGACQAAGVYCEKSTKLRRRTKSPAVLIQHMGRLVTDQTGTQRFAGTTTGIHFVLSTQQAIKTRMDVIGWFPESCFRLYLLQMPTHEPVACILGSGATLGLEEACQLLANLCPHPPSYYASHVQRFVASWSAYFPIIAVSDYLLRLTSLLEYVRQTSNARSIGDDDCCIAFHLVMILLSSFHFLRRRNRVEKEDMVPFRMTAITHGLPKLINDTNVDIDMPVDCELQVVKATDLTYPLPGEYRRGGPEKMERLSAELQSWRQRYMMHSDEISSPPRAPLKNSDLRPTNVVLPLMSEVARLLIHRPGLTFDRQTLHFRQCLDVCTDACTQIINLASKNVGYKSLNIISPPMCGLIFQSALMHVFYHCHSVDDHCLTPASSAGIIQKAIEFLNWTLQSQTIGAQDAGDTERALGQVIQLLRAIMQALSVLSKPSSFMADSIGGGTPEVPGVESQEPGYTLPAHELNSIFDELMSTPLEGNDLMVSLDSLLDADFGSWAST